VLAAGEGVGGTDSLLTFAASVLFLCWKIGSSNVLIPNNVAGKPLEPNFFNPHSHTYIFELEKSMCATS